jgi:hypothetical protein
MPPFIIALGSIILVWVACLIWFDITFWNKDVALIFFGSRKGELISLGIGMQLIHYLLIGLAFQLSGLALIRVTGNSVVIEKIKATKNEKTLKVLLSPPKSAETPVLFRALESEKAEARARIIPTKMVRRKTVILKPRFDKTIISLVGEKLRDKLFTRRGFIRRKASEVQLTSIEKYYEQFLVVQGKYSVDHYKSLFYTLKVDKKAREVFIFDEKIKPEPSGELGSNSYKVIKLTGVSSYHYEDQARGILDIKGREIDPVELGNILNKEWPQETISNFSKRKKFSKVKVSPEVEIDLLRSKIVKRPPDVGEVIKEIFEINERVIINSPMYQLTFKNVKNGKEFIVKIDGINGDIILSTSDKIISGKFIEDLIQVSDKNLQPIEPKYIPKPSVMVSDVVNEGRMGVDISPVLNSQPAKIEVEKEHLVFPAKVKGDILHVGDRVTAIVGDLEIPSGTTVFETLVVKGNLIIGEKCKMFGTVKALGNITIGANTFIRGNVVSDRNVSVGLNVKINGRVVIEKAFHSKSSVVQGTINE